MNLDYPDSSIPPLIRRILADIPRWVLSKIRFGRGFTVRRVHDYMTVDFKGGGGIGGTFDIEEVRSLPAIPTQGGKFVFWMSETRAPATEEMPAGTGDDQLWIAYEGQDQWFPVQFYSGRSGIPV